MSELSLFGRFSAWISRRAPRISTGCSPHHPACPLSCRVPNHSCPHITRTPHVPIVGFACVTSHPSERCPQPVWGPIGLRASAAALVGPALGTHHQEDKSKAKQQQYRHCRPPGRPEQGGRWQARPPARGFLCKIDIVRTKCQKMLSRAEDIIKKNATCSRLRCLLHLRDRKQRCPQLQKKNALIILSGKKAEKQPLT